MSPGSRAAGLYAADAQRPDDPTLVRPKWLRKQPVRSLGFEQRRKHRSRETSASPTPEPSRTGHQQPGREDIETLLGLRGTLDLLPLPQVLALGSRLCDALIALHRSGDAHGGLSLSPERKPLQPIERSEDIFGIGHWLYEHICGMPPFEAHGLRELKAEVRIAAPLVPSKLVELPAAIAQDLDSLILQCLEPEPADRPTGIEPVKERLETLREALG